MKRLKAIALLIIAGFFVLAPPGTLILIAVLIAAWVGDASTVPAIIVILAVLGAVWILVRARRQRKEHKTFQDR